MSYKFQYANRQRRCLEYLICFGGDWKITSDQHETVQDIAVKEQKDSIVELLNKYSMERDFLQP